MKMKLEIIVDRPDIITVVVLTTDRWSKMYIRYEPKDFWHEYIPELAHVRRVRYAKARQNLNTLLEEERKRICHPSL